jgi:hypothetical protein
MTAPHPALSRLASLSAGPVEDVGDEGAFLASVSEHRMTAVALAAHEQGRLALSPSGRTTLAMWQLAERRRHLGFWQALREVQSRLTPMGVEVAVLKGIATEARWYDELGQRAATDLDLLLSPAALDRAVEVARRLDPGRGCSDQIDWLVRRRLLQHVDLRLGSTQIDLHFDPFKIGIPTRQLDTVWDTTELLETPHGPILVLRPEIELVLLLLHLNKDRFAFLGPFLDVRRMLDRAGLDWGFLEGFVAAEGLAVPVWRSLAAVAVTLELDVGVPRISGLRPRTWERLWGAGARLQGDEGRLRAPSVQPFLAAHARHRTADNLRELRRRLLPPRQLLAVAGRLDPGRSYARHLVSAPFRRSHGMERVS